MRTHFGKRISGVGLRKERDSCDDGFRDGRPVNLRDARRPSLPTSIVKMGSWEDLLTASTGEEDIGLTSQRGTLVLRGQSAQLPRSASQITRSIWETAADQMDGGFGKGLDF
jgi:hypothetical protein